MRPLTFMSCFLLHSACVGEPQLISENFSWSVVADNIEEELHGICESTTSIQVVGEKEGAAYMLEWKRGQWSRPVLPPLPPFRDCFGWNGNTIAVGDSGALYTRRIETWSQELLPGEFSQVNFVDVWGNDNFQVIAGNRQSDETPVVLIFDEEETWTALDTSSLGNKRIHAIWALNRNHVWIAGENGLLATLEDRSFVQSPSPTEFDWVDLSGAYANEIYALGRGYEDSESQESGQLIRYDGEAWSLAQQRELPLQTGWTAPNRHLYWAGGDTFLRNKRDFVQFAGQSTDSNTRPNLEVIDMTGFANSVVSLATSTEDNSRLVLSHGQTVGGGIVKPSQQD